MSRGAAVRRPEADEEKKLDGLDIGGGERRVGGGMEKYALGGITSTVTG